MASEFWISLCAESLAIMHFRNGVTLEILIKSEKSVF